uniref:MINDY deubiquitinase domain-containing protein n=1 Tax=Oryza punctata TaxID=4537 RepID=A0A0E0LFK1_ORYPU
MSTDQPHLPPPAPPPGAAADPESTPAPPPQLEPPEVMHKTRAVDFLGRRTPIVYQNDNGPCPLLAICNVMLLKNVISLNPDAGEVSQQKLLSLVAERLIDSNSNVQGKDEEYVRNREQNISDAIDLLPRLATGIDVNVMFRKIDDFEFTRERAIFDLLDIPLYHGWIVDPQDTDTATSIGSKSYNALASGLAEFKSGESTEENKHVQEEETVDFAAATTAALGVPSPSVSRGRSFDENTLTDPVELHIRRGDREEEEELRRVLSLSKAENANAVDGSGSFDASQSHSSSNMEETAHTESFRLEAVEAMDSTNKEEHGNNHALSDGPMLQDSTNAAPNINEVGLEESQQSLTSNELEDDGKSNILPEHPHIIIQSSESALDCSSHESSAHNQAAPALGQVDKESCEEQPPVQIHGQASDTEVSSELTTAASQDIPNHATKELDGEDGNSPEPIILNLQESEPIYQGEEHILSTGNLAYENQEPVYEGEVVLAEQADKTEKSSEGMQDGAAEHQWELIDNFLQNTASQLTVYGLFCLQEGLNERELCVFFRNNHFNTMFKYNGSLYLLATDQGFFSQSDLVWQKLDEVNGDGVFLTSNFTPFKAETPRNDSWNEQQAMTSTADYLAQFDNTTLQHSSGNSDLELAIALQQQEFERQQPQRHQSSTQQQELVPQQQQQTPNQSHGTGRPGLVVGPTTARRPPAPQPATPKKEKCIVM